VHHARSNTTANFKAPDAPHNVEVNEFLSKQKILASICHPMRSHPEFLGSALSAEIVQIDGGTKRPEAI